VGRCGAATILFNTKLLLRPFNSLSSSFISIFVFICGRPVLRIIRCGDKSGGLLLRTRQPASRFALQFVVLLGCRLKQFDWFYPEFLFSVSFDMCFYFSFSLYNLFIAEQQHTH
jgi:hypothetical protein